MPDGPNDYNQDPFRGLLDGREPFIRQRLHDADPLAEGVWFCNERLRPHLNTVGDIFMITRSGEDDNGNMLKCRCGLDLFQGLSTVFDGHVKIEQYQNRG